MSDYTEPKEAKETTMADDSKRVHLRPLLTVCEAQTLLAALDGEALEGEQLAALDRAKAKLGRAAKGS